MTRNPHCPLCSLLGVRPEESVGTDGNRFDCDNCGPFELTGSLEAQLASYSMPQKRLLSHVVRKMNRTDRESRPRLSTANVREILGGASLPRPAELIGNLILYVGGRSMGPGASMPLKAPLLQATLGAVDADGVNWATKYAHETGLLAGHREARLNGEVDFLDATLTPAGWVRYEELQTQTKESRLAFMAMKFGDATLNTVFAATFKVAARRAGYDLRKLDEEPRAGLIDDRLRLDIRRSRFTIVDLSHGNRGAYWEAGYAEGLGRPVIYTCRADVFHDKKHENHPHFDANHYLIVPWDPANPREAEEQLVTTIRATLPAEALLEDPA